MNWLKKVPVSRPKNRLILILVAMLLALPVQARDYRTLYSAEELQRANGIYSANIEAVLFEDIAQYLLGGELETLQRVTLLQPPDRWKDPFEFSASADAGLMLIPTLSVKFLDDLAIAIAWFERFGCNKESLFDYVAALDFSDRKLPAPLPALKVPNQAYKLDAYVDDVSQKILKSALAFILLHELGHLHHRHRGYDQISAKQAQAQEAEADQFAMRVLRRMRLPPLGATVWFSAVSMRDPLVPGSPRQTHPLTSNRLQAIAAQLRTRPGDFIEPANRGKLTPDGIRAAADEIERIGTFLADPDFRSFLRERGRRATPELLSGACTPEQHNQQWLERFKDLTQ
ncbi:hypothetical protein [Motiliproteus sp.]|uniref:hypothetical protein n=1 Tax=Motiliproteus sp. TaxID=1898955 RepID=UPI003BACFA0B